MGRGAATGLLSDDIGQDTILKGYDLILQGQLLLLEAF